MYFQDQLLAENGERRRALADSFFSAECGLLDRGYAPLVEQRQNVQTECCRGAMKNTASWMEPNKSWVENIPKAYSQYI